jgi:hypothetical protein
MQAESYYAQRAAELQIAAVPQILHGEPRQLIPNSQDSRLSLAVTRAQATIQAVEPFAIAGIPEVHKARNEPLAQPEWQHIYGLIPSRGYETAADFANKRFTALVRSMRTNKLWRLTLEAVARDEVTDAAVRRACRIACAPQYVQPENEAAQVYLLARAYDEDNVARQGLLTIVQAVAHRDILKKQFTSVRFMGAPLIRKELGTMSQV